MGYQMIKQPDGKFAIFHSNSDEFMLVDATKEQVYAWWHLYYLHEVTLSMGRTKEDMERVGTGKSGEVYFQFALLWKGKLKREYGKVRGSQDQRELKENLDRHLSEEEIEACAYVLKKGYVYEHLAGKEPEE